MALNLIDAEGKVTAESQLVKSTKSKPEELKDLFESLSANIEGVILNQLGYYRLSQIDFSAPWWVGSLVTSYVEGNPLEKSKSVSELTTAVYAGYQKILSALIAKINNYPRLPGRTSAEELRYTTLNNILPILEEVIVKTIKLKEEMDGSHQAIQESSEHLQTVRDDDSNLKVLKASLKCTGDILALCQKNLDILRAQQETLTKVVKPYFDERYETYQKLKLLQQKAENAAVAAPNTSPLPDAGSSVTPLILSSNLKAAPQVSGTSSSPSQRSAEPPL